MITPQSTMLRRATRQIDRFASAARSRLQRRVQQAILLALLTLPATLQAQTPTALEQRLRARLDSLHAAGRFPGLTLGVALPDGSTLALAVGQSDTVAHTPMRPRDRLLAGSVGKTFFAALALQLVAEGRMGLDDPIAKYLGDEPWFARLPNGRDVTIRNLMNHTSGMVRYEFKPEFARDLSASPDRVWKPEEQIAYILDSEPPFATGQGWEYSDTNYIVLGMIMERVMGAKAYDEIRRRLLAPLALDGIVPQDSRSIPGLVQGYVGAGNPFGGRDAMLEGGRLIINPQFEWAGGGFATTAVDLARWARALHENKAFPATLNVQVYAGVPARGLGPGARYGLGVIIVDTPLGVSYGHSGFFPGYLTEMRYYPQHRFAVALQVNTSAGRPFGRSPAAVLQEMAQIVADQLFR
jgi:D-alanyl-D-alanine carboxypeptidase